MFNVHVDPSQQLLTMTFSERVETFDMGSCVQQTKDALIQLNPGFCLLTNLNGLEFMDPACASYVVQIMELCDKREIGSVVRVIPDATKDIGFSIMSQFHYGSNVKIGNYETLADAMRSLARDMTPVKPNA